VDASLKTLLYEKITVAKSKGVKTESNLALPMMMMMMMMID
jgi:hypothetical protein